MDHGCEGVGGDGWIPYEGRTLVTILASIGSLLTAMAFYEAIDLSSPTPNDRAWLVELVPVYLAIAMAVAGCVCGVRLMQAGFPRWFKVLALIFVLLNVLVALVWLQALPTLLLRSSL